MREHVPPAVYKYADRIRKTYWKLAKPERFGVKALVIHPDDPDYFLAVRQSYGNTNRYNLPGGGYKPKKETVEAAMRREVGQEVGLALQDGYVRLDEVVSTNEGKKDNITILGATAMSSELHVSNEIAEALWTPVNLSELSQKHEVSAFISRALAVYTLER